jgi:4-amino-4-deoxy-L-arabinose transferase-like glycosyltransferase
LLFFHRLADRDLWSSHEARAAMDAESILDGDYGLPHLNDGRAELQKPPLYYWLVALTAQLRGGTVDAWAVRLPAALAALGCVLLLVWFGRRIGRPGVGLVAALILATAIHFPWLARIGRIDMPLTFAVSVACVTFYLGAKPQAAIVGYLAVAVAILLKGPIGAVLPAVVMVGHRLTGKRTPTTLWWGIPLVLVLTLPWFLWVNAFTDGEFFREFFWYHNVQRAMGGSTLRSHAWWLYVPYFANDFLPWTPLLVAAGLIAWRRGWLRTDSEARFGLVWLAAVVGVLSCAQFKRADYLLPAYPGAALFLACTVARLAEDWQQSRVRSLALRFVVGTLAIAVVVGWVFRVEIGLPAEESFRDYRRFAAAVRAVAPRPEPVVFFRTEAHALAFHVGRPLGIVVEWEKLQESLADNAAVYVVMPPQVVDEWPSHLTGVRLYEVLKNTDLSGGRHERPLVLLRAERESTPCPTCQSCCRSPTNR